MREFKLNTWEDMTKMMNSVEEKGLSTIGLIRKPRITTFERPERLSEMQGEVNTEGNTGTMTGI